MPVQQSQPQPKPRAPRRYIKVVIVIVLLAVAGIYLANRTPGSRHDGSANSANVANAPAHTTNAFYNDVCNNDIAVTTSGSLKDKQLAETSGITASRLLAGAYFVHNDSGDSARIFSIDTKGKLLGVFNLTGIAAVDWEDIDSGPGPIKGTPYIYVADTGDNNLTRGHVEIYRIPEPSPDIKGKTTDVAGAETLNFTYPDNLSHNTEAVFVDPISAKLYFVDKSDARPGEIYEAPAGLTDGSQTVLTDIGQLSYTTSPDKGAYEKITAADISPDGSSIAIRTYEHLYVYNRAAGSTVADALQSRACVTPTFYEQQGEAVAFKLSGMGMVTTSEGEKAPIHSFDPR